MIYGKFLLPKVDCETDMLHRCLTFFSSAFLSSPEANPLKIFCVGFIAAACVLSNITFAASTNRPNIVLIFTDDMGWGDDGLEFKDNLMIQAVQYKILGLSAYGYEPEFYFWVFSTTNPHDFKIIKVNLEEELYEEHAHDIQAGLNFLQSQL